MRELGAMRDQPSAVSFRFLGINPVTNTNQGAGPRTQEQGNPSILPLLPAPWSLLQRSICA